MTPPPEPAQPPGAHRADVDLPRTIGLAGALGIMIGVTVGSGIFRTPHDIAAAVPSTGWILALWTVGGLLSLFGALTYAELAAMYPRSGGIYNFLHQGLGPGVAFTFGWTYMLLTKPFAAAGITVIFVQHALAFAGYEHPSALTIQLATCGSLAVLTWINVRGMELGAGVSLVLTVLKVAALLAIVLLAAVVTGSGGDAASPTPSSPAASPVTLVAVIAAMQAILWTYDGWSDIGSVAGEVRDPQRTLPRVYLAGTAGLVGLYLAVNAAYLHVMSPAEMAAVETVAPEVVRRLAGSAGAAAVTGVIALAALGASHAAVITGARVTFAQARDGLLFRPLGAIHPRWQTPAVSLWVQLALSCLAVVISGGGFARLAEGFVFTMWIFYGLAGLTVFILRRTAPGTPRPYRCPGYPVVPALFVLAALAMTAGSFLDRPLEKAAMAAILPAGWIVYALRGRFSRN